MTEQLDKCPTCGGSGMLYLTPAFSSVPCPQCHGMGVPPEVIIRIVQTVPGTEMCLGGHVATNKERMPWGCGQPDCQYYWPPEGMPKKAPVVDNMGSVAPPDRRKLLHKWLGGQTGYFQSKVDSATLWELIQTIERRRG